MTKPTLTLDNDRVTITVPTGQQITCTAVNDEQTELYFTLAPLAPVDELPAAAPDGTPAEDPVLD